MTRLRALRLVLEGQPQLWRRPRRAWQQAKVLRNIHRQIDEMIARNAPLREISELVTGAREVPR